MNECVALDEEGVAARCGGEGHADQLGVIVELFRQRLAGPLHETDEVRERADETLFTFEHRNLPLEHGRAPPVIGVEERQVVSGSEFESSVARRGGTPVGNCNVADPGVVHCRDDGSSIVRGPVVYNQNFRGLVCLREHRGDALGDVGPTVVGRNDDRDPRIMLHRRILRHGEHRGSRA